MPELPFGADDKLMLMIVVDAVVVVVVVLATAFWLLGWPTGRTCC